MLDFISEILQITPRLLEFEEVIATLKTKGIAKEVTLLQR